MVGKCLSAGIGIQPKRQFARQCVCKNSVTAGEIKKVFRDIRATAEVDLGEVICGANTVTVEIVRYGVIAGIKGVLS